MINICYISQGKDYSIMREVSRLLKRKGISTTFIAKTKDEVELHKNDGVESLFISEIIKNSKSSFGENELRLIDFKYGPPSIREICNSDRYVRFLFNGYCQQAQLVARAYQWWEEVIRTCKFDYFIAGTETASFPSRTAYNVARLHAIPFVTIYTWSGGEGYFNLNDRGEEYCWSEFVEAIQRKLRVLTEDEAKFTSQFIETTLQRGIHRLNYHYSSLRRVRELAWGLGMQLKLRIQGMPLELAMFKWREKIILQELGHKLFTRRFFRYDMPNGDEHSVFFPLFYNEESSMLSNHYYWSVNSLSLVRHVADSLPAGIKLYVKEHPDSLGTLTLRQLNQLRSVPNVRIIEPKVNSIALIKMCRAVFVLEGTAGWEAFISQKPVISIGSSIYYLHSRLIYKVRSIGDLSKVLLLGLKEGEGLYEKHRDEWLWFIYNAAISATRGRFLIGVSAGADEHSEGNYKRIADHIEQKVRKSIHKKGYP